MEKVRVNVNVAEGRVELDFGYRIPKEQFDELRAAKFRYVRSRSQFEAAFSAKAVWAAMKVARDLGHEIGEVQYTEEIDDYSAKVERYNEYRRKALERADQRARAAWEIIEMIPPGQPVLVDHSSAKRHRRDLERADNNMRKAREEEEKAEYWDRRADAVLARGERFESLRWLRNRIKDTKEVQRRIEQIATQSDWPGAELWREYCQRRLEFLGSLVKAAEESD